MPGVAGVRPPEEGVLLAPGVPGVLDLPGVPGVLPGVLEDPLWFLPFRCPAVRWLGIPFCSISLKDDDGMARIVGNVSQF